MICYKGLTFCDYYKKCKKGDKCKAALTPKVEADAKRWCKEILKSDDILICHWTDYPDCFEEKK